MNVKDKEQLIGKNMKETVAQAEMHCTVVKRNGQIAPFRAARIAKAIEGAFKEARDTVTLSQEDSTTVAEITETVVDKLITLAEKGVSLSVEGIQDMVEVTLMDEGFHDVGRCYIIYRENHKQLRDDAPQNISIFRKDEGTPVRFNPIKITSTLQKLFHEDDEISHDAVVAITEAVIEKVKEAASAQEKLHVHDIQDLIERSLMEASHFDVAKQYILLRMQEGTQSPKKAKKKGRIQKGKIFHYVKNDGKKDTIAESEMLELIEHACRGLHTVSAKEILEMSILNFYEGMKEHEIDTSHIMAAKAQIELEPDYSKVSMRLLLDKLYREAFDTTSQDPELAKKHAAYFPEYIAYGIEIDRLSPRLKEFDLEKLANAMQLERDDNFMYLGLQTLYDRYFIHDRERRMETPQIFWMRVAMGLALNEEKQTEQAIEFYNLLSEFYYTSSTPTLFNSGTMHSQLSSCFLSTVGDDLENIFKVISDDAKLSKWSGGLGNDWTNVRGTGARIKGTNGKSQGVIPFLKVANDTAVAVNQGGKRKGAMCAYLETWHIDVEDFLELRKNTGDERRRTHDMNTANWIPDLFMQRVQENKHWTLFSPDDTPDLHDLYGSAFKERYEAYEKMTETGEITLFKKVEALTLWRKMLSMLFETGHPWITFKDPSNVRSPQDHKGVVHSSNLCTEILLNTSKTETAVCNLGSINLAKHVGKDGIDQERLKKTVTTAIRMLDNVIDINFYPIPDTSNANLKHRPIGLGIMGFQDALYNQGLSYASHEAVKFADESMEMISYYAILASSELAQEKGAYESFKGSKWDRGILPIDSIDLLTKERGGQNDMDTSSRMDWDVVRASIKKHGMRNSNTMAIAPTATIANIVGVTSSIEPPYKHLYAKSNLSGEFTIVNPHLVDVLKERKVWDSEMVDDLKYFDGSLMEIERVPQDVKHVFPTCFEIEPEWIIECASRRQKWIDMGQSCNLYLAEPSGKKLNDMYMLAWQKGLKTTYYLRTLGATQIEKSTTDINKRGLQPRWMKNASPSSRVKVERKQAPKTPTHDIDEGCESCQ